MIFPEVLLLSSVVLGPVLQEPRDLAANPKAVAAQTFKTPSLEVDYQASRVWETLAPMFAQQYRIDPPSDVFTAPDPTGASAWVAFPWSLREGLEQTGCAVWLEDPEGRARVRHIRLYASLDAAERDNSRINGMVTAALYAVPEPLQR